MKKIYVYLHVCCINNWKSVVSNIYDQIKESGLYEKTEKIKCSVIGCKDEFLDFVGRDGKTEVIFSSTEEKYFASNYRLLTKFAEDNSRPIHNEEIILNKMFDHAKKEDFYVLYLHSKGVKRIKELPRQNKNIEDWVDLMLWFNVYNFEYALERLKEFDAVGVNIEIIPERGNPDWRNNNKREPEKTRFTGKEEEPRPGLQKGHIPNSINIPFNLFFNNGYFIKDKEIRDVLDNNNFNYNKNIISSCGSGVTACVLVFALELIGEKNWQVYDGSWSEWGLNKENMIET